MAFRREVEAARHRLATHTKALGSGAGGHRDEAPIVWLSDETYRRSFREWVELDVTEREALADAAFGPAPLPPAAPPDLP